MAKDSQTEKLVQQQETTEARESDPTKPTTQRHPPRKQGRNGWKVRTGGEFPHVLEQRVYEETNWRGTWVLEVKDMGAVDWGIEQVSKETGMGVDPDM
ncbi:hypothetical protein B0T14DRAFT_259038 [Immersiella caudata]|uniref:Uncharacterized protein n=1 Tax=Immersiella caudata TaxID=314043 RepID=A0AA39WKK5_9PEZI|nr:hypothetical protein B0T14DRAFT_259038 [Immersiella caudata]